jgi:hypothetical protein
MSAEALARLANLNWDRAEASSTRVEKAISQLYQLIEAAEEDWALCKFPEARQAERDLKVLYEYLWAARYGR